MNECVGFDVTLLELVCGGENGRLLADKLYEGNFINMEVANQSKLCASGCQQRETFYWFPLPT